MSKIQLYCIPFAGGNKYSYREFENHITSICKLTVLEYPGRGKRTDEKLITDMNLLVKDLFMQFRNNPPEGPYSFYGHSMGGLMTYLLVHEILKNNVAVPPEQLFITGTTGPSAASRALSKTHLLAKADFISEIKKLQGIPSEMLLNEELINYFEPILRADFTISETFSYRPKPQLNIPVTVITGTEEELSEEEIQLWQKEYSQAIDFRKIIGGHFFIYTHTKELLQIINEKLSCRLLKKK